MDPVGLKVDVEDTERADVAVSEVGSEVELDGSGNDVVKALWPMVVTRTVSVGMRTIAASVLVDRTTCGPTLVTITSLPRSVLMTTEGSSS